MPAPEPTPASPRPDARIDRAACIAAWLFPVLCWVLGTLYLGGKLGKSTDDYAINLRDPVTNAVPSPFNPLEHYPFFWRPLHNIMCFGVGTLWPEANRSVHVFVALCHGLACLGLFLLLRELTRTRLAPALATLLFMVYPLHGEVAFWFCTTSTAIGSALCFWGVLLGLRFARADRSRPALLLAIFALVFLVACFYEQSAALCALLPFLCFAVAPRSLALGARLWRASAPTLAAGAACILYILLLLRTAPADARGGSGSIVTAARLAPRLHEFLSGVRNDTIGVRAHHLFLGGVRTGIDTLSTPRGLVCMAFLLAAAVLWTIWAARRGGLSDTSPRIGASGAARWLALAGTAAFLAGWLPVFVIDHQIVEMRNVYVPLLGAAVALAGLLDMILASRPVAIGSLGAATRSAAAIGAVCLCTLGVLSLIGYQTYLQRRWQQDLREIAELKRLVPSPPPHTVFVPLRTRATAASTGYLLFDRARYGVFETPWSALGALRFAYRRADIGATSFSPWLPPSSSPLDKPGLDGARWTDVNARSFGATFAKDPDGGVRIPWANMVPFVTAPPDKGNELRLVRRIEAEQADHRDVDVFPPLVQAALDGARARGEPAPAVPYRFLSASAAEIPASLISIDMWKFGDGSEARFIAVHPWSIDHRAVWLASEAGARASMSVQMPPLDRPEYLLIRATIADYDLDPARNPIARVQELTISMGSDPKQPIARLRLDPLAFLAAKHWTPLVVKLPARPAPAGDAIIVTIRDTSDPPVRTDPTDKSPIPAGTRGTALPVWVTHGYEQAIVETR